MTLLRVGDSAGKKLVPIAGSQQYVMVPNGCQLYSVDIRTGALVEHVVNDLRLVVVGEYALVFTSMSRKKAIEYKAQRTVERFKQKLQIPHYAN